MAERSAEERINLWYQQFDHALSMSRQDFYSNAMATYAHPALSLEEHTRRFQAAIETVSQRVAYLQQHPAEMAQDRSERLAAAVYEALRQSPRPETPLDDLAQATLARDEEDFQAHVDATEGHSSHEDDPTRPSYRAEEFYQHIASLAPATLTGADLAGIPELPLTIDTTDTDMGRRWQDQLAALDARMEKLVQQGETERPAQRRQGMGR